MSDRRAVGDILCKMVQNNEKNIEKLEENGYNMREISGYAKENMDKKKYDEVYTEYRVKQILGE